MKAEPVTPAMFRKAFEPKPKPEPRAEFERAMTTALVPLTTVVDALTLRLEAVEAEAVEVLGLGR